MEKNIGVISPTDAILKSNINLVDLEYDKDSLFPKDFKFNPSLADTKYQSNEINLNEHLSDWKNTNLKLNGTDILKGFEGENITLFLLDTLSFGDMALSAVSQTTKTANATKNFEAYKKVNYVAQKISNYKDLAKNASYYIGATKLSLKYLDLLMKYAEVGKNDNDPASINWRLINATTIKAVELLEKITKTTISIKPETEKKMLTNYRTLFNKKIKAKWTTVDVSQVSTEESIKVLAKVYKKADIETREELINTLFIGLAQEVIGLYQESIKDKIKDKNTSKKDKKKLKEKLLYTSLAKGFLTAVIYAKDFDYMFKLAKKEPKIILNSILDIGGAVASAYNPLKDADTAEAFFKKYTYKRFVKNTKNKFIKNIYKNGGAYMKAVSLGETIANKLIPFTWDLFLAPDYLSTSIKNGKLQKFGLLKSKVLIKTEKNNNFDVLSNYDDGEKETIFALEKGDRVFVYVDASQDKLFDETVSPWILNSAYVPHTLWDILITTPDSYTNSFSCVRKIYGDVEYSYHWDSGNEYQITSGQCGVGEGGFDLDWGSEWYKDSDKSKLYETTNDFPSKYKLLSFSPNIEEDNLNAYAYTYNSNKVEYITVNLRDINSNNTFYKIKLVPALKNVNFTTNTSGLTDDNLIVSFNNANIEASSEDPIKSYTYNWGDGQSSTFTTLGNTTHTYSTSGKYTVTLTVTTESGITYTFTNDIYAEPNTPPVANAGEDITVLEGESVTLDGSKSSDADGDTLTYHWQLKADDGTFDDSKYFHGEDKIIELPMTLLTAGSKYTFRLTVTDSKGATSTDEVTITINKPNTPPTANAGTDQTVKEGESVTLDASGSSDVDGDELTYIWTWKSDVDDSILEKEAKSFEVAGLSVGEHIFTLTVKDSKGAVDSDEVNITVTANPTVTTTPFIKKTGQTIAYAKYDDGFYEKGVTPNYTKESDGILDRTTGLVWQDDSNTNGTKKTWSEAKNYCDGLTDSWRLPTRIELSGLVRYDKYNASIDDIFAHTTADYYWTQSISKRDEKSVWAVSFSEGVESTVAKISKYTVRCVKEKVLVANAGADQIVKEKEKVNLVGSYSPNKDNISHYKWSENGKKLGDGEKLSLDTLRGGVHTITLTVTDKNNNTDSDTMSVTIISNHNVTKKTGQNISYAKFDDGYYEKGIALNYSKKEDNILDRTTGLLWQDSDETNSSKKTWQEAKEYCATLENGNWRLPTRKELSGLVRYDNYNPSSDKIFAHTASDYYWSLDTNKRDATKAWLVSFSEGVESAISKDSSYYTRCVQSNFVPIANAGEDIFVEKGQPVHLSASNSPRKNLIDSYLWENRESEIGYEENITLDNLLSGRQNIFLTITNKEGNTDTDDLWVTIVANGKIVKKTGQTESYADYDDGYYQKGRSLNYSDHGNTVTDNTTGLEWKDDDTTDSVKMTWEKANEYCSQGNNVWRLPTRRELSSLVNYSKYNPSINDSFNNTASDYYWTIDTSLRDRSKAWAISFAEGVETAVSKSSSYFVRCLNAN